MKKTFEIHFEDLRNVSQHYLCETFNTTPEEEDKKSLLTTLKREVDETETE